MSFASYEELSKLLEQYPDTSMIELLVPDINGILRGKRVPAVEFETLFKNGVKHPATITLLNCRGEFPEEMKGFDGDPDKSIRPVANSLAPITWLKSDTAQVLGTFTELNGEEVSFDPRNVLKRALKPLHDMGLKAVVAVELEFYLLKDGDGESPILRLPKIPGTGKDQSGIQYAMPEDLWENDDFLEDVRLACKAQNIPMTTVHSEFSPGQFEINLHHCDDPIKACDDAVLLKRVIKGVARQHGMFASFMAKPFDEIAGCGLHVHFSLYDEAGNNIFADTESSETPAISDKLRHAIGGLAATMDQGMAIFAPNANSYRRVAPGNYVPMTPNWGYNHRDVALRIPVSGNSDRRVEHRVSGADASPYLVMAAIASGIHYGMQEQCDPGPMVAEGSSVEETITLPTEWPVALDKFAASTVFPSYLGEEFFGYFNVLRRDEYRQVAARVSNIDYEWYLRSV
ncbi:MAG: glutamine synthetase family protein [Pseudomonadales bacterium]